MNIFPKFKALLANKLKLGDEPSLSAQVSIIMLCVLLLLAFLQYLN